MTFEMLVFLIVVALAFDFMNGFHDAANSIATIVSTGVLSPNWAVLWAAFFNFVAFAVFGLHVASTIGKGIIDPALVDHYVVFGALMGGRPEHDRLAAYLAIHDTMAENIRVTPQTPQYRA